MATPFSPEMIAQEAMPAINGLSMTHHPAVLSSEITDRWGLWRLQVCPLGFALSCAQLPRCGGCRLPDGVCASQARNLAAGHPDHLAPPVSLGAGARDPSCRNLPKSGHTIATSLLHLQRPQDNESLINLNDLDCDFAPLIICITPRRGLA